MTRVSLDQDPVAFARWLEGALLAAGGPIPLSRALGLGRWTIWRWRDRLEALGLGVPEMPWPSRGPRPRRIRGIARPG